MEKKKGILYITHEVDVNGASKSLIGIISKLEDKYDIHVLVRGTGELVKLLQNRKCKIIIEPYYLDVEPIIPRKFFSKIEWPIRVMRYVLYRNRKNERIVKKMVQYIKKNNISLIHTNSSSTFVGIKIAKKANVPHVWHFREFLKEDFNLHPLIGWKAFYGMAASSDKIICVSQSVLNKYIEYIDTDLVCIYNGIEQNENLQCRIKHTEINVLQAGVLSVGKGTDVAIKALRILHEKGYSNIHLYLAGKGNLDFCKKDYEKISNYVHILGYVQDLVELRSDKKIDIELVCSKSEAFGRGTIEAMANGNPVIGSDTAGTKELIQNGVNGYLYRQGNAFDLADKIAKLADAPNLIAKFGRNGYDIYIKKFTLDHCVNGIEKIYETLM